MAERLLIVDENDKIVGTETKEKCHERKGILHRAFTVFLFNDKGQLLIQKRSKLKKLWPGYWENSCSSHPLKGESYVRAGERRLKEELRISCRLKFLDKFQYQAFYKNVGSENEICAILIGKYNGKIKPNPKEVAAWKWIGLEELEKEIEKNPQKYTPWLKIGLKKLMSLRKEKQGLELKSILNKYSKLVEPVIEKILNSYVDKKHQKIVRYQILTGGKRLRPALAIICCQLLGGKVKDVLPAAAGLEILHNYSLIIDDMINNSNLRREKPTCWFKFGRSIAECVAVDYSAAVFQAANRSKYPVEISEIFAKTTKTIVDGEILDILFEQSERENEKYVIENRYNEITEKDYLGMVSKKTTALIEACCEIGAIVAGAKESERRALKNYDFNLGIAFQIKDDILDIFGKEKEFGKKIGKDIEERKLGNIVIFYTLKELSRKEKEKFLAILRKSKIKNKDIKEGLKLINKTKSKEKSFLLGERYIKEAKESLKNLPQNKWNKLLAEIANFVLERNE